MLTVVDATDKATSYAYRSGDVVAAIDSDANTVNQFVDAAGRVRIARDEGGNETRTDFDNLNLLTRHIDLLGGLTEFTYDPNGNLSSLEDPRAHTTTYTYDPMDRVATRVDPLVQAESFTHDANGNLTSIEDRADQVTVFEYDALDRRTFAGFDSTGTPPTYESTVTFNYDAGNRLLTAVDSTSGTITRTYDGLDRLTAETTPQGVVGYAYDAVDRPTSHRARYYDPVRGRFLSEDPLGFAARDPNLYRYVGNDPIDLTDPSGEIAPIVVIGAGCAAGALAYGGITVLGNAYSNIFLGKRKDLFDGFDLVDAAISCGAGVIGGIVAGPGWAALQRVAIGAITGFESTLASQANHGDRDPSQLVLGTVGGGAAAPLPIPAAHEPAGRAFGGGFVLNVGVGMGQTIVQEGVEELINWLEQFLP